MRLELAGVTLDSSTDDLNSVGIMCGYRDARQHRNDLSMDSGIQGSSCDLAAASSGSDLDDDSLNGWVTFHTDVILLLPHQPFLRVVFSELSFVLCTMCMK
jgi:hypothetical protein